MGTSRIARCAILALFAVACCLTMTSCMDMGNYAGSSGSGESLADRVTSGLSIQAKRGSETLDIKRAALTGERPAGVASDTWTVFVYMCGSDLESKGAAASNDLNEMLQSSGSNKVRFVVETGGAKTWRNNTVNSKKLGRYLIERGSISEVGSAKVTSMGESSTLFDFLDWGIKTYPAEHMGLILWDHGGGSISGVCFDERNGNDSLFLRELESALSGVSSKLWDKFDFIGFDACLMGTLETANVLATYADYMYASQESEPASGWEYRSIVDFLAKNPTAGGSELGKSLCDSYLKSVDRSSRGFVTLSVIDLSKVDDLLQAYYRFSQEMYESGEDQGTLAAMVRGIKKADAFGCNNPREGYTNMVDLGGLVKACAEVTPSAGEALKALDDAVSYQVSGTLHADSSGLSTYYPLSVGNSKELSIFQTVAVNPSYISYVDRVAHGATFNGGSQYQNYSPDTFYPNDFWSWLLGTALEVQQQTQGTWDYVDDHTPESTQITFATEPQLDDEGTYWFQFDQHGIDNASVVSGMVYEYSEDESELIYLGETYDVYGDWKTGKFADGFDGIWLSLPDGQNLNLTVERHTDDTVVYSSPVTLNGTKCFLRIEQGLKDGSVTCEGAWSALASNGAVDRGVTPIKKGDVIVPSYDAFKTDATTSAGVYEGEAYKVTTSDLKIAYAPLPDGDYRYRFCIHDAFGDAYATQGVDFETEDGQIYFFE